jgi:hypothetical protein
MSLATLVLAMALSVSRSAYGQTYWFESYERVVQMIDRGDAAEASPLLDLLIRNHPYPIPGLKVPGDRSIDYLPHFQRARIQVYRGDARAAAHSLDIEEAFGAVLSNKRASKQLLKLRQQIETMEAFRHPNPPITVAPASAPH